MSIDFYCGITGDTQWNHHPVNPGALAFVSPVYGRNGKSRDARVLVPDGVTVGQDSGAFSDKDRVTFQAALDRQIAHAEKHSYTDKIKYRVAYDWLIDEVWQDG